MNKDEISMRQIETDYHELKRTLNSYLEKPDLNSLDKVWEYTKLAHTGQKRFSGLPYVSHSLEVANILAKWKLDLDSIIAGLLHDAIEDGGATREDIVKEFGTNVAVLVDGVTKVASIRLRGSNTEEFVENLRKMFLAMAKDFRVVLIKLADRLHNMRTLQYVPKEKQKRIALETVEVFAPLAERLGMGEIKAELEDLAFPYVYEKEFEILKTESSPHYKEAAQHIKKMTRTLLTKLAQEGIRAKIQARKKHLYSLWKKLNRSEIAGDFSKIHDIVAMRIIVSTIPECYTALGLVHSTYKPVPHIGISDFIAQPKPNGYQSIHTKVFGPGGRIVEVQIRTFEMHKQAEYGVAAHWAYSEAKKKGAEEDMLRIGIKAPNKLSWVKQIAEWQNDIRDSDEFLKAVKFDALSKRIFVFSPKGDVYDLPDGATPIDFACSVHTKMCGYIKQAIVNGHIVPLNYHLKSGDVAEIVKTKNLKIPSKDWMKIVATNTARREINKLLK